VSEFSVASNRIRSSLLLFSHSFLILLFVSSFDIHFLSSVEVCLLTLRTDWKLVEDNITISPLSTELSDMYFSTKTIQKVFFISLLLPSEIKCETQSIRLGASSAPQLMKQFALLVFFSCAEVKSSYASRAYHASIGNQKKDHDDNDYDYDYCNFYDYDSKEGCKYCPYDQSICCDADGISPNAVGHVEWPADKTSIPDYAFYSCYNLTSIVIPRKVTSIGYASFYQSGLQNITFEPDSQLERIEGFAFGFCDNLTSIIIPKEVTSIGQRSFQSSGLQSISFEPDSELELIDYSVSQCRSIFYTSSYIVESLYLNSFFGNMLCSPHRPLGIAPILQAL